MGARGTKPDVVTIQGITDTYENFGKKVGLQKESMRHRVIRLGVEHPMVLASREEHDRWWRDEVRRKRREKVVAETGLTPEEHRARKKAEKNRRYCARRRGKAEAARAMSGTLEADRKLFSEGVDALLDCGADYIIRYRHRGLVDFLVALGNADDPTPEEMAEMEKFKNRSQSAVKRRSKTTTCDGDSCSVGAKGPAVSGYNGVHES